LLGHCGGRWRAQCASVARRRLNRWRLSNPDGSEKSRLRRDWTFKTGGAGGSRVKFQSRPKPSKLSPSISHFLFTLSSGHVQRRPV
jgi:hypothetical protein